MLEALQPQPARVSRIDRAERRQPLLSRSARQDPIIARRVVDDDAIDARRGVERRRPTADRADDGANTGAIARAHRGETPSSSAEAQILADVVSVILCQSSQTAAVRPTPKISRSKRTQDSSEAVATACRGVLRSAKDPAARERLCRRVIENRISIFWSSSANFIAGRRRSSASRRKPAPTSPDQHGGEKPRRIPAPVSEGPLRVRDSIRPPTGGPSSDGADLGPRSPKASARGCALPRNRAL